MQSHKKKSALMMRGTKKNLLFLVFSLLTVFIAFLSVFVWGAETVNKQVRVVQPTDNPSHALIIGINSYQDSNQLPALRYAESDASRIQSILESHGEYSISYISSQMSEGATRSVIMRTMHTIQEKASAGRINRFLFYFSGHGYMDEHTNYLACQDTDVQRLQSTALNLDSLLEVIKNLPHVHQRLIFIDACRNREHARSGTDRFVEQHSFGMYVVFSTRFGALSYEDPDFASGVFTHYLELGLLGAADANADQRIYFFELMQYLNTSMMRRSFETGIMQIPVFTSHGEASGDIPVLRLR